jgi:DNA-binding IscR family transcriptional regulator
VVRALEGPIALSHCLEPGAAAGCFQADDCVARMVWSQVGEKIEAALDSISFERLLRRSMAREREQTGTRRRAVGGKGAC